MKNFSFTFTTRKHCIQTQFEHLPVIKIQPNVKCYGLPEEGGKA